MYKAKNKKNLDPPLAVSLPRLALHREGSFFASPWGLQPALWQGMKRSHSWKLFLSLQIQRSRHLMMITADELLQKPRPGNRMKTKISPTIFKVKSGLRITLTSSLFIPGFVRPAWSLTRSSFSKAKSSLLQSSPSSEDPEGWTCQERLRWRRHFVLFQLLCHQVSCPIQQQTHVFPTLPFATHVLVERLLVEIFLLFYGPTTLLPSLSRRTTSKTGKTSTSHQAESRSAHLCFFTTHRGCKHHRFWMEQHPDWKWEEATCWALCPEHCKLAT